MCFCMGTFTRFVYLGGGVRLSKDFDHCDSASSIQFDIAGRHATAPG